MPDELEEYKKKVEEQQETLLRHLAKLGIAADFDWEIQLPPEDSPLAEMFFALKVVADNLGLIARDRDKTLEQLREKLKLVEHQRQAILELSTPVIQVWDEILVLPLVGTFDTNRARQLITNLLDSIVKTQALVAIVDITGVPMVDTQIGGYLLRTMDAARMLGAEVILTGVSPHNAQTLVKLGVELGRITTKGTLQAGLKHAFELTNNRVAKNA